MRVVSLVPSVTETLLAWGVRPVAVTRFCEQPGFPTVGGTKDPDVAAIVALEPDLVVVNDEENRRADADALAAAGVRLHVTSVRSVADVAPFLTGLAEAVDVASPETPVPPSAALGRRAFVPIWRRPWMTLNADTYGSSMLETIGIANVYARAPDRYPTVELDDAAARRPDVVLAPSEPYPFRARHVTELKAVADDVRLVDGRDLFWWGARTAGALQRLAQAIGS
ncbi:MAG TPA: helical backbone metal receptor [Acidimicrobiales bacterium]|nr:helical backbone metal receptor [Acidimicrobiales bacterium]